MSDNKRSTDCWEEGECLLPKKIEREQQKIVRAIQDCFFLPRISSIETGINPVVQQRHEGLLS
jgi:hypothetical protein